MKRDIDLFGITRRSQAAYEKLHEMGKRFNVEFDTNIEFVENIEIGDKIWIEEANGHKTEIVVTGINKSTIIGRTTEPAEITIHFIDSLKDHEADTI